MHPQGRSKAVSESFRVSLGAVTETAAAGLSYELAVNGVLQVGKEALCVQAGRRVPVLNCRQVRQRWMLGRRNVCTRRDSVHFDTLNLLALQFRFA
jgi:hypothetical protein